MTDPNRDRLYWAEFTPDGTKLVGISFDGDCIHIWDLPAIRRELSDLGLDWDAPPYPPGDPKEHRPPLQVSVDLGHLAPKQADLPSNPEHSTYSSQLRKHYRDLAETSLLAKEHGKAADAAVELSKNFPENWEEYYWAARLLARCAALAAEDSTVSAQERHDLPSTYGGLAMQLLGQASKRPAAYPDSLPYLAVELADLYRDLGRELTPDKIEANFPNQPSLQAAILQKLGVMYHGRGEYERAIAFQQPLVALRRQHLGPDHPDTLRSMNHLAVSHWSAKQLDKSIPLFEDIVTRRVAKLGRNHPDTLRALANLGVNYRDAGRLAEALPLLEEAHRAAKEHPTLRWVQAAALAKELLTDARTQLPKDSPELAQQLAYVSLPLLQARAYAEAEPLLRECLAIRQKTQPDVWSTFNARSMLGGALLGQKKYTEAEPLLLAGYEGMTQREKTISPRAKVLRLTEALERLVQLYDEWGKKEEGDAWRKKLDAYKMKEGQP